MLFSRRLCVRLLCGVCVLCCVSLCLCVCVCCAWCVCECRWARFCRETLLSDFAHQPTLTKAAVTVDDTRRGEGERREHNDDTTHTRERRTQKTRTGHDDSDDACFRHRRGAAAAATPHAAAASTGARTPHSRGAVTHRANHSTAKQIRQQQTHAGLPTRLARSASSMARLRPAAAAAAAVAFLCLLCRITSAHEYASFDGFYHNESLHTHAPRGPPGGDADRRTLRSISLIQIDEHNGLASVWLISIRR